MRKMISTHVFRRQRLQPALLKILGEAGLDGIEIFCARTSFDYHDRAQMIELAAWFREHPLPVHSLHSPIYADERDGRSGEPPIDLADPDHRRRVSALDEVERVLEFRDRVPFSYLVQHLGPGRTEWDQHRADRALGSLERLRLLAKQAQVQVLVENIPNGLSMPEALLGFLSQNHLADVGVCFDSGHANLPPHLFGGGGVEASWEVLKHRALSTHLHDNRGSTDDHLWPGEGTIAWDRAAPLLAAKGAEFPWLLEVGEVTELAGLAGRIQSAFAQLERWAGQASLPAQ